jgi:hypothetical protein
MHTLQKSEEAFSFVVEVIPLLVKPSRLGTCMDRTFDPLKWHRDNDFY